ncbi:GNAT family N-acetyltransferase [Mesorhizobium xinjiangense]|uniref:GNAT family N-acetyltransferase n=1 Tax=Mesorhizobium xinjiangense TaxID=2678685 RepID=UPI0012EE6A9D|nr:GNAT family N-acetyltransferase [Mesorhizobium xinjiangense]
MAQSRHHDNAEEKGRIRLLTADDRGLFCDHLLRLDATSRRDRFNGVTDDEFVRAYAARCFAGDTERTIVVAYVCDGRVEGAAELHETGRGELRQAEIAFSVEDHRQNMGIGSWLFERLIEYARTLGYQQLLVTTHPQNEAMKALARRFSARLSFQDYETLGTIDLGDVQAPVRPPAPAAVHDAAGPVFANLMRRVADFRLPGRGRPARK